MGVGLRDAIDRYNTDSASGDCIGGCDSDGYDVTIGRRSDGVAVGRRVLTRDCVCVGVALPRRQLESVCNSCRPDRFPDRLACCEWLAGSVSRRECERATESIGGRIIFPKCDCRCAELDGFS